MSPVRAFSRGSLSKTAWPLARAPQWVGERSGPRSTRCRRSLDHGTRLLSRRRVRVNGGCARRLASFDGAGTLRLYERVSQVSVRLRRSTAAHGGNGRPWAAGDYVCREGDRFVDAAIEAHRKMQRSPEKLHSRPVGPRCSGSPVSLRAFGMRTSHEGNRIRHIAGALGPR